MRQTQFSDGIESRKAKWSNQSGATCTIEDKLIEEVVEDQFFNCIVEVRKIIRVSFYSLTISERYCKSRTVDMVRLVSMSLITQSTLTS